VINYCNNQQTNPENKTNRKFQINKCK